LRRAKPRHSASLSAFVAVASPVREMKRWLSVKPAHCRPAKATHSVPLLLDRAPDRPLVGVPLLAACRLGGLLARVALAHLVERQRPRTKRHPGPVKARLPLLRHAQTLGLLR